MKIIKFSIIILLLLSSFCFGIAIDQANYESKTVIQIQYVPQYITQIKEVYQTQFKEFSSQEELGHWQAVQYLDLQELGEKDNWICVDYALEIQRRAWLEGYQMSIQLLIVGKEGHAICSTWMGKYCIFLEPQSTQNWIGVMKSK